jgi:hypothetical protein
MDSFLQMKPGEFHYAVPMERKRISLWVFLGRALRHTWVYAYGVLWSVFGSATRIRDNFLPESWKDTLQTRRLLSAVPRMTWQVWMIGLLVLVLIAIVRSALMQLHAVERLFFTSDDELTRLKTGPFAVELEIHEIFQRPAMEVHAYWNRDIFLRVSANLTSPQTAEIAFHFTVILRGRNIETEWLNDVNDWCRRKIVRSANPFISHGDEPCFLIDALPVNLERGVKVDGWLHFRTNSDLTDGLVGGCAARLIARSSNGAGYRDIKEGSIPVIPSDWQIIRKDKALEYAARTPQNPQPPPI